MLVLINAGHDPTCDPGAVNHTTGLREADVARDISLKVCHYLQAADVYTIFRQADYLSGIINEANEIRADLFVSIHCNSFSNPQANGIETLYYPGSNAGAQLAHCIQAQLLVTLGLRDRGVKSNTALGVLRLTNMPACLAEIAFISNIAEEQLLASAYSKEQIAKAIARGVTDYMRMQT